MRLIRGDCLEIMPTLDADSIDSIVTDPPYGLSFMGKDWDHGVPGEAFWRETLRVAKPGAHLLAFGGTRTHHRLAVAIEDAGWEIRDCLGWLYGSGFPKSHNLDGDWQGWGTALKPAWEPVILARKPLVGTVVVNVLAHGTGALNIDGCRVGTEPLAAPVGGKGNGYSWNLPLAQRGDNPHVGRWPANLIHDGSDEVTALFPKSGSGSGPREGIVGGHMFGGDKGQNDTLVGHWHGDSGSAARFFYCAKASKADRDEGCEALGERAGKRTLSGGDDTRGRPTPCNHNHHPTVKPTALMRYLCRLITPPGGVILDPFCGSGSTGKAAVLEGFDFIGIDTDADYLAIAEARIAAVSRQEALALA